MTRRPLGWSRLSGLALRPLGRVVGLIVVIGVWSISPRSVDGEGPREEVDVLRAQAGRATTAAEFFEAVTQAEQVGVNAIEILPGVGGVGHAATGAALEFLLSDLGEFYRPHWLPWLVGVETWDLSSSTNEAKCRVLRKMVADDNPSTTPQVCGLGGRARISLLASVGACAELESERVYWAGQLIGGQGLSREEINALLRDMRVSSPSSSMAAVGVALRACSYESALSLIEAVDASAWSQKELMGWGESRYPLQRVAAVELLSRAPGDAAVAELMLQLAMGDKDFRVAGSAIEKIGRHVVNKSRVVDMLRVRGRDESAFVRMRVAEAWIGVPEHEDVTPLEEAAGFLSDACSMVKGAALRALSRERRWPDGVAIGVSRLLDDPGVYLACEAAVELIRRSARAERAVEVLCHRLGSVEWGDAVVRRRIELALGVGLNEWAAHKDGRAGQSIGTMINSSDCLKQLGALRLWSLVKTASTEVLEVEWQFDGKCVEAERLYRELKGFGVIR